MTKALDAAVRAICQEQQSYCEWPKCQEACAVWGVIARRAITAALPAAPPEWWAEWWNMTGMHGPKDCWRALRTQLLGEAHD